MWPASKAHVSLLTRPPKLKPSESDPLQWLPKFGALKPLTVVTGLGLMAWALYLNPGP